MTKIAIITALMGTLALAGCNIHKQSVVKKQDRAEVSVPKVSLESLDLRVSDIERRMAAARAAAKAKAHAPLVIAR